MSKIGGVDTNVYFGDCENINAHFRSNFLDIVCGMLVAAIEIKVEKIIIFMLSNK
ncbi:hypothetical protein P9J83_07050 [Clostridium sporogenes]|uniref:Uncharacterized protein n=1 Tax=Clostridium sporogenes TaxID=1509 RepID=A0AAE4FLE6_CLOSG|nr:hypothetical protein [Clostridium sporogenes]MDS1003256.1 hypothetical protein [Clostridium sporogenes]